MIAWPRGRDVALVRADGSQDRTIVSLAVSGAAGHKPVCLLDGMLQPVTDNGSFGAIDWR